MRHLVIRLIAIALLAVAASQLQPRAAQACIKFDRAAEMALIDKAIASRRTSAANKAALRGYRDEMIALRERTDSRAIAEHGEVTTKALALIGKQRIVWRGTAGLNVGVFKHTKSRKAPDRKVADAAADGAIHPACG